MLHYRFLRTERGILQASLFTEFIKTVSLEHLSFFFLGYLHERLQIHFFDKSVTTSPICWLIVSKDPPLSLRLTTVSHTLFFCCCAIQRTLWHSHLAWVSIILVSIRRGIVACLQLPHLSTVCEGSSF